jgi:hypothetical protein
MPRGCDRSGASGVPGTPAVRGQTATGQRAGAVAKALEEANRVLRLDLTLEQVQVEGPYILFEVEGYRFRCGSELYDAWLHLQMTCPVCEQTFDSEPIHSLHDLGQVLEGQVGKRPCPQHRESDEDDPPVEIQLLELIQQICDERVGREVGGHETEYHSQ